jgi:hypothetical protein
MIKIEKAKVMNFEGAFRGLRNPKNSWHLSDSVYGIAKIEDIAKTCDDEYIYSQATHPAFCTGEYVNYAFMGQRDLNLGMRMVKAGTDESKFLRQIFVSVDIEAPLMWWKEFDTYKIGTVSNSCSTMHKLADTPITKECFSYEDFEEDLESFEQIVKKLEKLRLAYKSTGNKKYWRRLNVLLPQSWMQKRTITLNYQVLRAIYFARKTHKLVEWREFCKWIESLPYARELICIIKEIAKNESIENH